MKKILLNKRLSYLLVVLTLIMAILILVLLTVLSQYSSLHAHVDKINSMIESAKNDTIAKEELRQYIESNEYIVEWARQEGLLQDDDIVWED